MVRSDHRSRFAVPPVELWAAMTRTDEYRAWWPWLRRFDGSGVAEGARWECVVQPPLPYSLRFTLELEDVEPARFVTASISGDITGHAAIDLTAVDLGEGTTGTELRLVSALAPDHAVLEAVARYARPLVRFGHDWVLGTGLRQFRQRALDR